MAPFPLLDFLWLFLASFICFTTFSPHSIVYYRGKLCDSSSIIFTQPLLVENKIILHSSCSYFSFIQHETSIYETPTCAEHWSYTPTGQRRKEFLWCKMYNISSFNLSKLCQPELLICSLWQLLNFLTSLVKLFTPPTLFASPADFHFLSHCLQKLQRKQEDLCTRKKCC